MPTEGAKDLIDKGRHHYAIHGRDDHGFSLCKHGLTDFLCGRCEARRKREEDAERLARYLKKLEEERRRKAFERHYTELKQNQQRKYGGKIVAEKQKRIHGRKVA